MNLELTQKEIEIIKRTFGSMVALDDDMRVIESPSITDATFIIKPQTDETIDEFMERIIEMRTDLLNVRSDAASFHIPMISDTVLDKVEYHENSLVYANYNLGPFYIKVTALKFRKNKKIKLDLMCAFVYVKGELGMKLIIPFMNDIIVRNNNLEYRMNDKYSFILGGNLGREIKLDNPRKIRHVNLVVCDIKVI